MEDSTTVSRDYADQEQSTFRPNANAALIAISALVMLACVCVLLLTSHRSDLWPTVAMIGSLCGFGALLSFFVTRVK
jgi:hypothetical protein